MAARITLSSRIKSRRSRSPGERFGNLQGSRIGRDPGKPEAVTGLGDRPRCLAGYGGILGSTKLFADDPSQSVQVVRLRQKRKAFHEKGAHSVRNPLPGRVEHPNAWTQIDRLLGECNAALSVVPKPDVGKDQVDLLLLISEQ